MIKTETLRTKLARFDVAFPLAFSVAYAVATLLVAVIWFPIGDIGVESDFYYEIGPAARHLAAGDFSVADFPFKGPLTAFLVAGLSKITGVFGIGLYRTAVLLNVFCAAAFLFLIYRLLRAYYPRPAVALATVSIGLTFEFFLHAHKASSDLVFLLLFYASVGMLLRSGRTVLAGIAGGLVYLTRYNGLVLPLAAGAALLLVAPERRALRSRTRDLGVYVVVFAAIAAPWYLVNFAQSGRPLATHNLQNIFVEEFYPGETVDELPAGAATSLPRLILHDPLHFAIGYLKNLPIHLWRDLRYTLNWGVSALFVLGLLRLLRAPPTRRQTAFLVFPLIYFLAMGTVYHQPRFSFPLLPAYTILAWSVVTVEFRPRRLRLALTTAVVAAIVVTQIGQIFIAERHYYRRRPLFVFEAAEFLRQLDTETPGSERPLLLARKPHLAFYADMRYQQYPREFFSALEFLNFAIDCGTDFIVYSALEAGQYPGADFLADLDVTPGIEKIYARHDIAIYRVAPWLDLGSPPGHRMLAQQIDALGAAETGGDLRQALSLCYLLSELTGINGDWDAMIGYLERALAIIDAVGDPELARTRKPLIELRISHALLLAGRHAAGIAIIRNDLAGFAQTGDVNLIAGAHEMLSRHYEQLGNLTAAVRELEIARELRLRHGNESAARALAGSIDRLRARM